MPSSPSKAPSPREKWDRVYAQGRESRLRPALERFYHLAPRGRALEIACGTGANALFLAQRGFVVDALDISEVALRRAQARARRLGLPVRFVVCDAADFPYPPHTYHLVVNFYFLERRILPRLVHTLRPGGLLIFETFNLRRRETHPEARPEHLLRPGELLQAFQGLTLVHYDESGERTLFVGRKPPAGENAR